MASMEGRDPLQCALCSHAYDSKKHLPKLLTCHHSFCLNCLLQLGEEKTAIKCPTCRKKTPINSKGVKGLQTNFYISQMKEVIGAKVESTEDKSELCGKHKGQPLLFFCETCCRAICMNCTVLDHEKAAGHVISDIASVLANHQEILTNKVANIEGAIEVRRHKLQSLRNELNCMDITKTVSEDQLRETFVQLKAKLDQRQEILINEIQEVYEARKNDIITQAQKVKSETKQLNENLSRIQSLSESGGTAAVIKAAVDSTSIADLDGLCLNASFGETTQGQIQFVYDKGLKTFLESVNNLGDVQATSLLPSVISISVDHATAGLVSQMSVTGRNANNEPLPMGSFSVSVVDPEGDVVASKGQCDQAETLIVRFRPEISGEHQVVVHYLQHALNSVTKSFTVRSNDPRMRIGEPGSGNGQLNKPTSVAVSPKGDVYVADMGNRRVQIFNESGQFKGQFKIGSSKTTTYDISLSSDLTEVICIKVAPDPVSGHMLADTLRVFDLSGEKKRQTILRGARNALFLCATKDNGIIVTDTSTHSVHMYDKEGNLLKTFGSEGSEPGLFDFPSAICAGGKTGEIFVSDTRNHRVQVFDSRGEFLHAFGSEGKGKGAFKSPRGIAADPHGNVLVADSCNRIQVFKTDGTFVSCIESRQDPINEPYNMAVTPDGHVYLADFKSCCIKKFKYF